MNLTVAGVVATALSALSTLFVATAPARADLASDVKAVLADKLLKKATVGIEIVALGDTPGQTKVLLRHDADKALIPASNLKLVTTAAALDKLGSSFRFDTRLIRRGDDLVLIGDGDPTLGDAELLQKVGWSSTTLYKAWATSLLKAGVTSVRDVIVDDSVFDEQFVHDAWPADQRNLRYVAGVAGLNFNANCLDFYFTATSSGSPISFVTDPPTRFTAVQNNVRTGENALHMEFVNTEPEGRLVKLRGIFPGGPAPKSVTIDDPALYAGTVLAEVLATHGVKVTGTTRRDRTVRVSIESTAGATASTVPTPQVIDRTTTPIAVVLGRANKDSMNLYAESLCKRLGFAASAGQPGSWTNGPAAIESFLASLDVPADQFSLDDGCGLSRANTISATAISKVLQHMYFGPSRQVYIDSLAVAGVDGTLDDRFRGSDLRGRVFGKSGFINNVSSLSGYWRGQDGRWYAFSILMNGIPHKSNGAIKPLQERIVRAADELTSRMK
jgi:D-alanyl-D-alanine carboxypeptidase/D-alanyl-D-alanine-endopeptidase (penicillin-binding protein 4)